MENKIPKQIESEKENHTVHCFLPNGIEVIVRENHFARAVAIQCWVKAGSLHEESNEYGMAHFIEHMLFKGTKKRAVGEIGSTVEACGGDINAYTTFDRTVFYLTLASKHAATGVDLLADAIFHSSFDAAELDREREVILEEIRRSEDDPGSKVSRKMFDLYYEGSAAARPIIGYTESVKAFQREDLLKFHRRWYRTSNMVVVVVGDVEASQAIKLIEQNFGKEPKGIVDGGFGPIKVQSRGLKVALIKGDYQQPRFELAWGAPPLEHYETAGLDLAAFALGSGELCRFNQKLRDDEKVLTVASASVYSPLGFPGVFATNLLTSEERILTAVESVAREVASVALDEPVTRAELSRACASLRADRVYRDETVDGQARSLGYSLMTSQKLFFDDVYLSHVTQSSVESVTEACKHWLNEDNAIVVGLLPLTSTLSEADVTSAFRRGMAYATKKAGASKTHVNVSRQTRNPAEIITLKEGVTVIYRRNPAAKIFSLVACSEGGLRGEDESTAGLYAAMTGLLANASDDFTYEQMHTVVEGLGASLGGFSGKDSFGMQLHCLDDQIETMLGLFASAFLKPVFPTEQWESLRHEILDSMRIQADSPASICVRKYQEMLFGDHPYSRPTIGLKESVESFTAKSLEEKFMKIRDGGRWTIACLGSPEPAAMKEMLQTALQKFTPKAISRTFSSDELVGTGRFGAIKTPKDREQSHVIVGFRGTKWNDPVRPALDVLVNALGGHGGRLFMNLRDRESLAYSVSPTLSYGIHPGSVGAYIACAPAKVEQALASLRREMTACTEKVIEASELERSKNYIVGSHEMDLQRCDSQSMTMALMELYGVGYDDFVKYPKRIEAVTQQQVLEVARHFFNWDAAVTSVVGPMS